MMTQASLLTVKRDYKSRMFIMIFRDKKKLLKLYNAVSGRNYTDPELLTITTLENAIYMSVKNDVSFIIDLRLSLYEHQSTYNPNMPLRVLFYIADVYSDLTKDENLYGEKLVLIPAPKFIVFYNGTKDQPDYREFRLSDAYSIQGERISLELIVDVYNINKGHNQELMDACKDLKDYAEYVYRVRKYAEEMSIEAAVDRTIDECIREDILKEFLAKNRAEDKAMSIYEYDAEKHRKKERDDTFEDGRKAGAIEYAKELLLDMLSHFEPLPAAFTDHLQEADEATLKSWTKVAARAESIEEFLAEIGYKNGKK